MTDDAIGPLDAEPPGPWIEDNPRVWSGGDVELNKQIDFMLNVHYMMTEFGEHMDGATAALPLWTPKEHVGFWIKVPPNLDPVAYAAGAWHSLSFTPMLQDYLRVRLEQSAAPLKHAVLVEHGESSTAAFETFDEFGAWIAEHVRAGS